MSAIASVSSKHDPRACLADIVENAERIASYMQGLDKGGFAANGLVRDAVERCLERICEAAHRLGDAGPALVPGQPWGDIRGMGNWLRHGYDRISLDVIWNAICYEVPGLAAHVKQALRNLANR